MSCGAPASSSRVPGSLVSRMRSGLLSRRRRLSSSSRSACAQSHQLFDTEAAPQPREQQQVLGLDVGPRQTETLHADLVELPLATHLRTLVAEHRAEVPQPLGQRVQQAVLQHRAHAARGAFRAQRQAVAVAVGEGVHLLLDDVGDLADGALEQLRGLQQRKTDLAVRMGVQQRRHLMLDVLPKRGLGRQNVGHSADGPELLQRAGLRFQQANRRRRRQAEQKNMRTV